nr:serine/threonine-protein kinase PLK4 [Onthophagus taurus]
MASSINSFSERIEEYEVHNLLGKGGFASVYRAKCLKTGMNVAIKMIDKKLMQAAGMVSRVRQEVSIHYRLKHPSILELYTFFEDQNYVYLVLELCHNGELQQYLKKHTEHHVLSESEASSIMRQVVEGVQYLHSHNILHRDMSLSNLLLTKDMQIKIADFGLATQLSRPDEKHMTMCGTPNFISPEVASRGSHGLEADVWSLGCLLYTLLVGTPPFDTQGVKSTLTRVVMANYQLPNYLSVEAKDLINSLLQKNPKDRIHLTQILEHPFIKRGNLRISSNLTHDSGVHTMSSKRESALSDGVLLDSLRKCNSDYLPVLNQSPIPIELKYKGSQSVDHLTNHFGSSQLIEEQQKVSVFSQGYGCIGRSQCSQKCCQPNDPGGGKVSVMSTSENIRHSSKNLQKLCSHRLLPTRHQTKNAILSILDDSEVCVEFIKKRGHLKRELVCEVCRISPDGERIILYEPENGKGTSVTSSVPELPRQGTDNIFSFENLPEKHWKKYMYAFKFVELVRAKTPKVTYYTDKAKCLLMENLVDFEACFYEGGKVTSSSNEGVTIIDSVGTRLNFKSNDQTDLPTSLNLLWIHAQEAKNHCCLLERTLNELPGQKNFPIIVGRRPNSNLNGTPGKENRTQPLMPSFNMTSINTSTPTSVNCKNVQSKSVSIPGIGTAIQLASGEVKVRYPDGSQIWVDGKHNVQFQYADGKLVSYGNSDNIPRQIVEKLQHMPIVLRHLMPTSSVSHKTRLR